MGAASPMFKCVVLDATGTVSVKPTSARVSPRPMGRCGLRPPTPPVWDVLLRQSAQSASGTYSSTFPPTEAARVFRRSSEPPVSASYLCSCRS